MEKDPRVVRMVARYKALEEKEMEIILHNLDAEETIIKLKREFIPTREKYLNGDTSLRDRLYWLAEELYAYGEGGDFNILQREINRYFWEKTLRAEN